MQQCCGWMPADRRPFGEIRQGVERLIDAAGPGLRLVGGDDGGLAAAVGVDLAESAELMLVVAGRPRFARDGPPASPRSAATLLTRWQAQGRALLEQLYGPFALAVIDRRTGTLTLAIDRLGIHSLAFAATTRGAVFATRADRVAAHPEVAAALSPQGLFHYLYFYQVPAPGTVFEGVEKLLPAEWVEIDAGGGVRRGFYWRLDYRDAPRHDFEVQREHFHALLRASLGRARGDDRVAAFLSGGTDSSTVAGVLTELQGAPARTYSIGFAAEGFDEMEYARLAAGHFGLDAREYYLTPDDVLATIPLIATTYDEPFANESAVSAYHCARLAAADGYRVMLGGDGGDEIFGGNERYAKQGVFELYGALPAPLRRGLVDPLAALPGMGAWWGGRKLQSYVRQARIPLPERMESYNFVHRQPLAEMFTADFLAAIDPAAPAALLRDPYNRAASDSYINRMLHLDLKFTLADNDLRKVSAMAAAAGVEVRYPLIDDAMVEFSGEVPPDWKVRRGYLRWFFKHALKGYLPDAIIDKRKHGFGLPFGVWVREHGPLCERVSDRLADSQRRGWLQPGYVERLRHAHEAEHATYFGKMLWVLVTLEEWLDAQPDRVARGHG